MNVNQMVKRPFGHLAQRPNGAIAVPRSVEEPNSRWAFSERPNVQIEATAERFNASPR